MNSSIDYHRELELRQNATALDATKIRPMPHYGDIVRLENTAEARFWRIALDTRISTLTTSEEDRRLLKNLILAHAVLKSLSPEDE